MLVVWPSERNSRKYTKTRQKKEILDGVSKLNKQKKVQQVEKRLRKTDGYNNNMYGCLKNVGKNESRRNQPQ